MKSVVFAPLLAAYVANAGVESWCDAKPAPELAALEVAGAGDDWFKVYAVAPSVFAISEPRQAEEVSSFLVTARNAPCCSTRGSVSGASARSCVG